MRKILFVTVAAPALIAAGARADVVKLHADLSAAQEVPAPKPGAQGTGTMTGTLDTATHQLAYEITYSGLTGPAIMAHIHGPAGPGKAAPIMYHFPDPQSPIQGTATLNDAAVKAIMDGQAYVNVHTADNPPGELRGQIMKE